MRIVPTLAVASVLLLGACAEPPAGTSGNATEGTNCLVAGTGGINDHGFNAGAWAGMQDAEQKAGLKATYLESSEDSQYATNIDSFLQRGCDLIVTVGFPMTDATMDAAKNNPDQKFAIVDVSPEEPLPNLRGISFNTGEGAFLAGYAAAGVSETGKVGTFGAMQIPAIELYMDGFARGVQHYNEKNNASVELLGWDTENQDGIFTGSFTDQEKAKQLTTSLLNQDVDVIFPSAAAAKAGAFAAIKAANNGALAVSGDVDGCDAFPDYCSVMLTSILKQLGAGVVDVADLVTSGDFEGGTFIGNLSNEGVGLAPFHENEDRVGADLAADIEQLESDIVAGKVQVDSPFAPQPE